LSAGGAAVNYSRGDPNGMERLKGESDAQYVERQTRLKEQAKARMRAKFGKGGTGRGGGGQGVLGGGRT